MSTDYTTPGKCRCCGSTSLTFLFSLGEQRVSDFPKPGEENAGPLVPIELELCGGCALIQQRHSVKADLYSGQYWFRSGSSSTNRAALRDVTVSIEQRANLRPGDVVCDLGANDGTLLRSYGVNPDWPSDALVRVGIEPAENLFKAGSEAADVWINDFWGRQSCLARYREYVGRQAKVVTALGMLYDTESPGDFVRDVAGILHPEGVFVAQLMCARQTIEKNDVGNYAHEHLLFFTLNSLIDLFGRHKLQIFDLEENNVNGGSYRLWVRHINDSPEPFVSADGVRRIMAALTQEKKMGLDDPATWLAHFERMKANRDQLAEFVRKERARGRRIWIMCASTKGNTLAQWLGLDRDLVEAAADASEEKCGRVMVGSGIPIVGKGSFREANPDYAVLMPYAFLAEMCNEEVEWLRGGGRFVTPLPTPMLAWAGKTHVCKEPLP